MSGVIIAGGASLTGTDTESSGRTNKTANPSGTVSEPAGKEEPSTAGIPKPSAQAPVHLQPADPDVASPVSPGTDGLERIAPRKPLSELALARPPKPKMPGDWDGTRLFQPVAPAAGLIEAKGYSVAISGVEVVKDDEMCSDGSIDWACGARARTAFRAFLRGRAVICKVPPRGGPDLISAQCRVGKQDIGEWLVENGWARAAKDGPYVQAADKARAAKKGIFGRAPDLSGLPPVGPVPAPVTSPAVMPSILDLSGEAATPQDGQPAPLQ
jgi:endonuclease YncB( thermonuclease family)